MNVFALYLEQYFERWGNSEQRLQTLKLKNTSALYLSRKLMVWSVAMRMRSADLQEFQSPRLSLPNEVWTLSSKNSDPQACQYLLVAWVSPEPVVSILFSIISI